MLPHHFQNDKAMKMQKSLKSIYGSIAAATFGNTPIKIDPSFVLQLYYLTVLVYKIGKKWNDRSSKL